MDDVLMSHETARAREGRQVWPPEGEVLACPDDCPCGGDPE